MSRHIIGGSVITPTDPLDVQFPAIGGAVIIADGADVALGATTNAAASSTVAETATARTGIGLWKAIKNILILMNAKFAALGQAVMAASMPVVIASDQSPVAARGTAFTATTTLTRPDNATQYTAGDVVVGLLTFASVGRANGAGAYVLNARVAESVAPAATGSFKLWLFNAAPTVAADNAVFAPTDAQMLTCLGMIQLDGAHKLSVNTLYIPSSFTPLYVKCAAGVTTIYGVLTDAIGYTPTALETLDVFIDGVQD